MGSLSIMSNLGRQKGQNLIFDKGIFTFGSLYKICNLSKMSDQSVAAMF